MKIVVDLQGAQSASRVRGIGRYALALAQALARNAGAHEIWLVLNGAFAGLAELQQAFAGLVPRARMRVFDPPLPVAEVAPDNAARARAAELLREYFIAQLEPDVVLLTSLFEAYVDDAVTSVGQFIGGATTAVVLYDLIPLLHPETYLGSTVQRDYYARKIASLRRAGLLLAISDHARREAIDALGLAASQVVAVSTAVDARFCPGPAADAAQLAALDLMRPFVMVAPGGTDARKNLAGLIAAFARLPPALLARYQLLIASGMDAPTRTTLLRYAAAAGLPPGTLVLSGHVDDALLIGLYRACTLFVFPSLHEGFGLPALEAMACGAAVIGADNTSLPEVIGLAEAMFDASDPAAMAAAIARALSDPAWLMRLRDHGRQQAARFSWDRTARRCLDALENLPAPSAAMKKTAAPGMADAAAGAQRLRLAFISPLPPARSGIADYAAQLLPALLPYFDIELVAEQAGIDLPPVLAALPRHDAAWFMLHGASFDQVLYQFGNSPFHGHMFALLEAHPGVVVLHDFFLSRVLAYEQMTGAMPGAWTDALYHSHGYPGLQAADPANDSEQAHQRFPCNLAVLQNATDIIVHSRHSKFLGASWYGEGATAGWHVAPLPRAAPPPLDRAAARAMLGIAEDVLLVCSFGFIAPTKLTHRLIEAWQASALGADTRCVLILVGANHGGAYGEQISAMLGGRWRDRLRIAGWADAAVYQRYLCAADVAVQLRCDSRGETSAAVLDCLNYGLATIVNANGSMAELPGDVVCMLDDDVSASALAGALEQMHADPARRMALGAHGRNLIEQQYRPAHCAALLAAVLQAAWQAAPVRRPALTAALAAIPAASEADLQQFAAGLARMPDRLIGRQLLVDVTTISRNDLRTGIERVVRAQVLALLRQQSALRIEPVRLSLAHGHWHYRYAHAWTQQLLGIAADGAPDHVVDVQAGDILFGADYAPADVTMAAAQGLYAAWRARGVGVHFQVFDLLPVLQPQFFPPGAERGHAQWLDAIAGAADSLVCISQAVADETACWLQQRSIAAPRLCAVPLGADFDGAVQPQAQGLAATRPTRTTRTARTTPPDFLMVGTIEPRKGHLQTLAAFELLWQAGVDAGLTIVGSEGWTALANAERRTIPAIVAQLQRLRHQPRLRWLQGADDVQLAALYRSSACLLVPSEGEGFGLPLIEATRHGLPVLARDLPVFREIGGDRIGYFTGNSPEALANAIRAWLAAGAEGEVDGAALPWSSWAQHAQRLVAVLTATAD